MKEVVIVSAKRTAIGSFGGSFKDISAVELGTQLVQKSLAEINLAANLIDEVIMGNVLSAGLGQNIARQIAVNAGVPIEASAFTVNKVCGSGLKAVILGAQSIQLGENEIVIAGGTESMSQSPYIVPNHRFGQKIGNGTMIDTMMKDGLTDAFDELPMGNTAENIAELYHFTREAQDEFSAKSQQKAEVAIKSGKFKDEIIPIEVPTRKGNPILVETDEFPRFGSTTETLAKLRPSFKKEGSVTAGNSSGINDGAAMVILMTLEKAQELGLEILGKITSYATSGVDPKTMGIAPVKATQKALEKANKQVTDLDLIEANEAFASQSLSVIKELTIDPSIINVNGGAIALGHPIGASGARILVTLLHEMKKREVHTGLATLCIGGGQGISLIVER
ncbi:MULTISPECIES: acetyl-CoA C-acetyltransferase [Vagococcus]|uniref:acetyl-CoA C-acetyltransferase n=1 Tax=Vagococcus fluvialis bH819 TaxID=1255619 RepID=A0A1X6WK19_9ENTE|nr:MULTISPECIES: acetyl-CoA C-acetyltransferase [Vagococcus]SLM84580.1 3-ketoacyl-CoA thiolase @ Acetyl-CoA acetyltransferase [Vagococcus fluvialis bH819]HCM89956.1 acetyl-CoA C-acetyltransferase [Vagococcus sp.]